MLLTMVERLYTRVKLCSTQTQTVKKKGTLSPDEHSPWLNSVTKNDAMVDCQNKRYNG